MKKNYQKYSKDSLNIREFIDHINKTTQVLNEGIHFEEEEEMYPEIGDEGESGMQYIDTIREAALSGMIKYKNDVDSPIYSFFKKVYMEGDKLMSEKENGEEE